MISTMKRGTHGGSQTTNMCSKMEDLERMKSMTVDEQLEYKSLLIEQGRYIE